MTLPEDSSPHDFPWSGSIENEDEWRFDFADLYDQECLENDKEDEDDITS